MATGLQKQEAEKLAKSNEESSAWSRFKKLLGLQAIGGAFLATLTGITGFQCGDASDEPPPSTDTAQVFMDLAVKELTAATERRIREADWRAEQQRGLQVSEPVMPAVEAEAESEEESALTDAEAILQEHGIPPAEPAEADMPALDDGCPACQLYAADKIVCEQTGVFSYIDSVSMRERDCATDAIIHSHKTLPPEK